MQDHVLFSWRLLVIDLVLMVYLLALFAILLRLGVDITRIVVENAMLKYVVNKSRRIFQRTVKRQSGFCFPPNEYCHI